MASKNGGTVALDPAASLASKRERVTAIDELLRKTAPSVTLIKEQVEASAREPWNLNKDEILAEILPDGSDQSKSVPLYDVLIEVTKEIREMRDAWVENAVKAEIAKRQTSEDAAKLSKLKDERSNLATEYETLKKAFSALGILPEGTPDLDRAPKVVLSTGTKRGPKLKNGRMVYAIDGENEGKYELSQVAFMSTQGINGTGTKLNVHEFEKLVTEQTGKDPRKEDFEVTIKFMKDGKVKRTKKVTGKFVEIPEDAPAATE
jgi:hypothetical protein